MNFKKKWIMLAIALIGLCIVSCGGGDDDEDFSIGDPNKASNTDNTEYLATKQVKTLVLKPMSEQELVSDNIGENELLIYKDYYRKYTLCLLGNRLIFNHYTGGGEGWKRFDDEDSAIIDIGEVSNIESIPSIYLNISAWNWPNGWNYKSHNYYNNDIFKPGHGYVIVFKIGEGNKNVSQLKMFPTKYTLNNNDVLTSITIDYQLY